MSTLTFEGGINEQDETQVNASECVAGYNFELGARDTHFRPRKAFDSLGTATNAGDIRGFIQNITNADVETTLVQSGDTVYLWDGSTTFTSKGSCNATSQLRGVQWTLDGYNVITDIQKLTVIKKWDGTTFSSLTTGLGSSLYAKYGIVHQGRVWLFNVKTGSTDTPHLFVASAFEDPTSYDTSLRAQDTTFSTGNEAFFMTAPDGRPINGVQKFYDTIVFSTEGGSLWKLTGSDSLDFAIVPFYAGSSATGDESFVNIGNDIHYMRVGGTIESLSTTDQYGDTNADDISRWIRDTVRGLTSCISVYDQQRQKVYFFAGSNKLLVYFKEMEGTNLSPWSLYKTNHASSFSTNAAIYMRQPGGTDYFTYFGDTSGNIYQLDGTSAGDPSSTNIDTYRKTKYIDDLQEFDTRFQRLRGKVGYHRVADVDLIMDFEWGDDYAINQCVVPLEGPPTNDDAAYWGGNVYWNVSADATGVAYWNSGFFYADRVSNKNWSPVGRGPGFYLELTLQTVQDFDIINIRI